MSMNSAPVWHQPLWPGEAGRPQGRSEQLCITHEASLLPEADQSLGQNVLLIYISLLSLSASSISTSTL